MEIAGGGKSKGKVPSVGGGAGMDIFWNYTKRAPLNADNGHISFLGLINRFSQTANLANADTSL